MDEDLEIYLYKSIIESSIDTLEYMVEFYEIAGLTSKFEIYRKELEDAKKKWEILKTKGAIK